MVSPPRQLAFRILSRVESGREFAVDLLEAPEMAGLSGRDHRLATELVMGVLRAHGDLDRTIEEVSGKSLSYFDCEIATILRLGIFQIRYLTKIPKRAAVDEAVKLAKLARRRSAAGLVNAVLRKCEPAAAGVPAGDEGEDASSEWTRRAVRSLPAWLAARWEKRFGGAAMAALARSSLETPPTVLRVESAEARDEVARRLALGGIETRPGRFSPLALIVELASAGRTKSPRSGGAEIEVPRYDWTKEGVVIQDEASQLVALLLAPRAGARVLDLCAAPGIKTGQVAQALARGGIVACDRSAGRLRTMRRLLTGFVPPEVEVFAVRLDASAALPFGVEFDRILVDAPCSGTGTLARNPEIKLRLVPEDLVRFAAIQARILANALKALARGGRLVYATCSLEAEENEAVVAKALRDVSGLRIVPGAELSQEFPGLRSFFAERDFFYSRPDLHAMDGFFAAVIERVS